MIFLQMMWTKVRAQKRYSPFVMILSDPLTTGGPGWVTWAGAPTRAHKCRLIENRQDPV